MHYVVVQCALVVWVTRPVKYRPRNDLNCVEWDVKSYATLVTDSGCGAVFARVQDCPKNCLACSLQSGKPWCNPNGCNRTHAYKSADGSCVGTVITPYCFSHSITVVNCKQVQLRVFLVILQNIKIKKSLGVTCPGELQSQSSMPARLVVNRVR